MKIIDTEFGTQDFLYDDGARGYGTVCGDVIHIERPEVVEYIEDILSQEFVGWGYMKVVEDLFQSGKITEKELSKIISILD
jgi:hypothetical protein